MKRLREKLYGPEIAVLGAGRAKNPNVKWRRILKYFNVGAGDDGFLEINSKKICDLIKKTENHGYKSWLLIHSHGKSQQLTSCDYNLTKEVQKKHPSLVGGIYVIELGRIFFYTTMK